jgi:hypothetical protein
MNTDSLANHYHSLTPRERFPLIVAAGLRGDESESVRLVRSAPTKAFSVPNFRGLAEGFDRLCSMVMMIRLELALIYEQISAFLLNDPLAKRIAKEDVDLFGGLRMVAYRFMVQRRAWKELCGELRIDAEALLKHCPGYALVKLMEEKAGAVAFSPEEAIVFMQNAVGESAKPETVPEALTALKEYLDNWAQCWT